MAKEKNGLPDEATEAGKATEETAIVPADGLVIRDLIYTVRGVQVMLDSDLAMLYGVEDEGA